MNEKLTEKELRFLARGCLDSRDAWHYEKLVMRAITELRALRLMSGTR